MAPTPQSPGIVPGRLDAPTLAANFSDIAPPLSPHEALVAADRCYFCHDAPCVQACPTSIDIPLFIREIATGATEAAVAISRMNSGMSIEVGQACTQGASWQK